MLSTPRRDRSMERRSTRARNDDDDERSERREPYLSDAEESIELVVGHDATVVI